MARLVDDFGGEGGTPARLPTTLAPASLSVFGDVFNRSGIGAAVTAQNAAIGAGADGRTILTDRFLLSILNPIKAPTYLGPADAGGWIEPGGEGGGPQYSAPHGIEYVSSNGTILQGFDGAGAGFGAGSYFSDTYDNPTGNGARDQAQAIYRIDGGVATPVRSGNAYVQGWWNDWGQFAATIAAVLATAGAAGSYLAAGGVATEASAAGAAGGAATVDAGAGALTIEGATASGFGSGLGIDGFGAGLGSSLSEVGAADAFGSLAGYGSFASVPANLTFAGQGISLGASLASTVQQAASTVAKAVPASPAATAAAPGAVDAAVGAGGWTVPSAGSILSGIGSAAGVVGTVAGAVNQLTGGRPPPTSAGTSSGAQLAAAQRSQTWLLILAGAAGVYLLARK